MSKICTEPKTLRDIAEILIQMSENNDLSSYEQSKVNEHLQKLIIFYNKKS